MNTTTNTIVSIHYNIAELISVLGGWRVTVALDDVGIYISMSNPKNENDHRSLTLSADCDENDPELSQHRWQFWNETQGIWFDSMLGAEANAEEILGFLKDCVVEESLPVAVSE